MTRAVRFEADPRPAERVEPALPDVAEVDLARWTDAILSRRPAVGFTIGVVRDGCLDSFVSRGLADISSMAEITEETVFRIGSVTKLFTAIAVMQLRDEGRVDLDAPASDYLRAYELVPAGAGWRPATLRHLLTHTAGVPEIRGLADLLQADLTPSGGRPGHLSVRAGERLPSLAEYYRGGLRVVVEPGTAFAYTNHGFATLGQIVEDVSGIPLERYLRERIFEPLGMRDTELVRSGRVASHLATGYVFGRRGPKPVEDREWTCPGAGGIYSTTRDMARFVAALSGLGANEHGRMLEQATLAAMFEPHYRPDTRLPGMGLGFFRGEVGGHRVVTHDGILPGFNSALLFAPYDRLGVIAFTNGSSGAFGWLQVELDRLLRRLLAAPDEVVPDLPHRPEVWPYICGRYVFPRHISDLRIRLMLSRGVEVFVNGGRLRVRFLAPAPLPLGGLPLEPDDEDDPDLFRLDLSRFTMPPVRVAFSREPGGRATAVHTDLGGQPWSLVRADDAGFVRRCLPPVVAASLAIGVTAAARRRATRHKEVST